MTDSRTDPKRDTERDTEREPIDQGLLDRLVDGELDAAGRRDALGRLEAEPDGWRRCGLAFLEAQALRSGMRAVAAGRAVGPIRGGGPARVGRSAAGRRSRAILGAAAVLLVGFSVGSAWPWAGVGSPEDGTLLPIGGGLASPWIASGAPSPRGEPSLSAGERVILALRTGSGHERELTVPLVEVPRSDPTYRWLESALYAEELKAALAEAGHEVVERRQLVPITLQDGRRALVPVEEVEVQPVRYVRFQ